jgi:hypothetical protein
MNSSLFYPVLPSELWGNIAENLLSQKCYKCHSLLFVNKELHAMAVQILSVSFLNRVADDIIKQSSYQKRAQTYCKLRVQSNAISGSTTEKLNILRQAICALYEGMPFSTIQTQCSNYKLHEDRTLFAAIINGHREHLPVTNIHAAHAGEVRQAPNYNFDFIGSPGLHFSVGFMYTCLSLVANNEFPTEELRFEIYASLNERLVQAIAHAMQNSHSLTKITLGFKGGLNAENLGAIAKTLQATSLIKAIQLSDLSIENRPCSKEFFDFDAEKAAFLQSALSTHYSFREGQFMGSPSLHLERLAINMGSLSVGKQAEMA